MYTTIRVYDERAYEAKLSLLNQELAEFRKLKIARQFRRKGTHVSRNDAPDGIALP